jgi:alanine racemase
MELSLVRGDASWVEIDAAAFLKNIEFFRRSIDRHRPQTKIGCVLKGNAYGHGIAEMARLAAQSPVIEVLYVFSYSEAMQVLQHCRTSQRIVILGALPDSFEMLPHCGRFEWVVSSQSQVSSILTARLNEGQGSGGGASTEKINVHIHFDTGLGREGFLAGDWLQSVTSLLATGRFRVCGCMTHFANTEDVTRQDYAKQQIRVFGEFYDQLVEFLQERALQLPERHLAASAATLVLPAALADVVRIGIGAYGLWPSNETRLSYAMTADHGGKGQTSGGGSPNAELLPVLSWRVRSQSIKQLDRGQFVGYGCTFRCERETNVAVFPVGYADGYVRQLTSHAYVLIEGHRCPVIGRVMMNHIIVAVSPQIDLRGKGSVTATLIGSEGDERITADDLANWSGTINYEAVTRIGVAIKRVIIASDS